MRAIAMIIAGCVAVTSVHAEGTASSTMETPPAGGRPAHGPHPSTCAPVAMPSVSAVALLEELSRYAIQRRELEGMRARLDLERRTLEEEKKAFAALKAASPPPTTDKGNAPAVGGDGKDASPGDKDVVNDDKSVTKDDTDDKNAKDAAKNAKDGKNAKNAKNDRDAEKNPKDVAKSVQDGGIDVAADTAATDKPIDSKGAVDVGRIAKTLQGMKAAKAGAVLLKLDPVTASSVVGKMSRQKASAILETLTPEQAAKIAGSFSTEAP